MIDEIALWWENMAGPRMLIEEMSKSLSDGKTLFCVWMGIFHGRVQCGIFWHTSSAMFRSDRQH